MDPAACLAEALEYHREGENTEALLRLSTYFQWRLRGGFAADDSKAIELLNCIAVTLEGE